MTIVLIYACVRCVTDYWAIFKGVPYVIRSLVLSYSRVKFVRALCWNAFVQYVAHTSWQKLWFFNFSLLRTQHTHTHTRTKTRHAREKWDSNTSAELSTLTKYLCNVNTRLSVFSLFALLWMASFDSMYGAAECDHQYFQFMSIFQLL